MPNINLTINAQGTLLQTEGKQDLQLTPDTFSPGLLFVSSVGG